MSLRDGLGNLIGSIQDWLPEGALIGDHPPFPGPLTVTQRVARITEWVMDDAYLRLECMLYDEPSHDEDYLPRIEPAEVAAFKLAAPSTAMELFFVERLAARANSSVTATQLYEDYCSWCDTRSIEPLALPSFGREFADLGVKKERIAGRVRYLGIALQSHPRSPTYQVDAALK